MNKTLITLCTLAIALAGCKKGDAPKGKDPEAAAVKIAIDAVDRFHSDLAANNVAEICRSAKPEAFGQSGSAGCEQYFGQIRDKLGAFISARRTQLPIASSHPARVGSEYDAKFQNGTAREHFEFLFSEGRPQLTSYRIKSDLLP